VPFQTWLDSVQTKVTKAIDRWHQIDYYRLPELTLTPQSNFYTADNSLHA
jgi:hypothetical protein